MHSIGSQPVRLLFEKNPGEALKRSRLSGVGLLQGVCPIESVEKSPVLTTLLLEAVLLLF